MNKMKSFMFPVINAASIFFQRKEIAKVINAVRRLCFGRDRNLNYNKVFFQKDSLA